ncbi:uncharacterized protein F5891DRAFT_1188350 [Suillus fuscotomentosus]|uniref:Uncharacterized protein n=1 Tax=Suillus fuscotomentosus TaxID=1912939 RepID=A0AAD4HLH3_9AGAM|nr:uncharacterized protein F5891DRAFT_1188350 [Suillus fuscotomentosus]KAG1900852.1 hypothetical protein F5891DRAFT_1188350 [Suillus fuscotomentosus]
MIQIFQLSSPPIGKEGFAVSHGGGEMELYKELGHVLSCQWCIITCHFFYYLPLTELSRICIDDRDRHDHTARLACAWADQYKALVDAYLKFCHQNPLLANLNTSTAVLEDTFSINIVDIFERQQGVFSHCSPHIHVSLMTHGCISSSPLQPTVAITIRTLEAYCQMHRGSKIPFLLPLPHIARLIPHAARPRALSAARKRQRSGRFLVAHRRAHPWFRRTSSVHPFHVRSVRRAGKEDFETCEWTFSESNALAPEIRNSTEFHRHQVLDEHFRFADQDKYAALSTFIYRNYVQALECIQADSEFLLLFDLTPEHFESDLNDEHDYLQKANQRQPGDSVEVEYTKALNELDWETAQHKFNHLDLHTIPDGFTNNDIANICRRRTTTQSKMEMKSQVVDDFETRMGIEERWTMTHPERYHKAVDDVERLVVMWLRELMKLQMSSLGYKLRTQIAKALKTRATAIRNALNHYNKYAGQLDPPRPPITWEQVVEFSQLAEFDLLQDTDNQLLHKHWAIPRNCQASAKYFDLQ